MTATTMFPRDVQIAVDRMITEGAEWEVRESDETVLRWDGLARHWRIDENRLIVRPLERCRQLEDGRWVFLMNESRPSYIQVARSVLLPSGAVGLQPADFDGFAVIRPITDVHAGTLARWDEFYEDVLTEIERSDADDLVLGDWWGNWA